MTLGLRKKLIDRLVDVPSSTLLAWWLAVVFSSAFAYQMLYLWAPAHAPVMPDGTGLEHFFNSLYFSVVTVTTVGYGDFVPQGASRAIAAAEGVAGFALFGMLVGKIASRRQERVIEEVHRHVVADTVAGLREGLFVVRKDVDGMIDSLKKGRVTDEQWETLDVALMHAELLIEEIPALTSGRFGDIDSRREALLAEATLRTLRRTGAFLGTAGRTPAHAERYRATVDGFLTVVCDAGKRLNGDIWKTVSSESQALRESITMQSASRPQTARRRRRR